MKNERQRSHSAVPLPEAAPPTIVALMTLPRRNWITSLTISILPIVGLITMLICLAVLQFRWSAKVSQAEREGLEHRLQRSTSGFQVAFEQDLLGICEALQASQPRTPNVIVDRLADRFSVWRRIADHASLVDGLYLWPSSTSSTHDLLRLNVQSNKFEPASWPTALQDFRAKYDVHSSTFARRPALWLWDEQASLLIHPVYLRGNNKSENGPQFFGYLFVVMNPAELQQTYLPQLGRKFFPLSNGFVFQIVEIQGEHGRHVVYQSDKLMPAGVFQHRDASISLLSDRLEFDEARHLFTEEAESPSADLAPDADDAVTAANLTVSGGSQAQSTFVSAPIHFFRLGAPHWKISVRHRSGSVDIAVDSLRRRNLEVSVLVLVTLLVSLVTILAATRRARRLARMEMEFASGVSHELRTPLAVIRSAAENLEDGVITAPERIQEYGALIHKESQRLAETVDNILDFARLHSAVHSYSLATVSIDQIINTVVANEQKQFQSVGVLLEVLCEPDLPALRTEAGTLCQCLQNLLSNALKYGKDGGRVILHASLANDGYDDQVLISVQDFGTGISPEDISHIFEPFYRTQSARDSQIRGTGLGLSLTLKMIEGLQGKITVESSREKGTWFTLHIPT